MDPLSITCENCGSSPLEPFVIRPVQTLWRCVVCDLYQKGLPPSDAAYESDYHDDYQRQLPRKLTTAGVRLSAVARTIDVSRPRMLDIGCSIGATVEMAQQIGWDAEGVDVSETAVAKCRSRGLRCHRMDGIRLPFDDESFDVVTSWHVIEHVENVQQTLNEWYRVVRPGGVMVLETPDAGYLKARLKGAAYQKFWAPEHIYTFRKHNLQPFLERAGFEILPNPVWAQVSLLSPSRAGYALIYRGLKAVCRSLSLSKAFEIYCRRPPSSGSAMSWRRAA